jgi:hypothetical protein
VSGTSLEHSLAKRIDLDGEAVSLALATAASMDSLSVNIDRPDWWIREDHRVERQKWSQT